MITRARLRSIFARRIVSRVGPTRAAQPRGRRPRVTPADARVIVSRRRRAQGSAPPTRDPAPRQRLAAPALRALFWAPTPDCYLARPVELIIVMSPETSDIPNVVAAVDRFRRWADAHHPGRPTDYWVFDYDGWDDLHAAVIRFLEDVPVERWTEEQSRAVLDAIHFNDEHLYLAPEIARRWPSLLIPLAEASMRLTSGYAARWQLAEQLGLMHDAQDDREQLLLRFARDDDEYVRRRALEALARLGSAATENLAVKAWSETGDAQQWSRMMALWALHKIGSSRLTPLLAEAERTQTEYLVKYAARIRRGEVDDAAARPAN
jgi:hypothetical protein